MFRSALFVLLFLISTTSVFGERFGGIEIGAKGVKWVALELDLGNKQNPVESIDSGDRNTTLSALDGNDFDANSLEDTIDAVALFYRKIHETHKVPQHKIFVVASSGLPKADNLSQLIDGVKKSTGQSMDLLSVEDEVRLGIHGLCIQESDRLGEALVIDIGSGNTKGGFVVPACHNKNEVTTIFHLPGTVTLTAAVKEIAEEKQVGFLAANAKAKDAILNPSIQEQLKQNEDIKTRRLVYMNGGIVWAIATFLHPEMGQHAYVPLTLSEFQQMRRVLQSAEGSYPEIDSKHLDAAAQKEVSVVKKVFSPDNLVVGTEILCTLGESLDFKNSEVYFVRNGRIAWLLGYVAERGQKTEFGKQAIAKKS